MSHPTHKHVEWYKNLMEFDYLIFFFSLLLFADLFLVHEFNMGIFSARYAWLERNVFFYHIIFFFLFFSVFYTVLVPTILFVVDRFLPFKDRYEDYDKTEWIRLETLHEQAIVEANSIIYSLCEKKTKELEKAALARKFSMAVVILLIVEAGFSIFTERYTMLIHYLQFFENNVIVGSIIAYCLVGGSIVLVNKLIDNEDKFSKRVHIPGYSSRAVEQWIAEINSGLIPKRKAFHHLNEIDKQSRGYPELLRFDRKNNSHNFLRGSGLIEVIKNKVHMSPKGKFISQFKDLHDNNGE